MLYSHGFVPHFSAPCTHLPVMFLCSGPDSGTLLHVIHVHQQIQDCGNRGVAIPPPGVGHMHSEKSSWHMSHSPLLWSWMPLNSQKLLLGALHVSSSEWDLPKGPACKHILNQVLFALPIANPLFPIQEQGKQLQHGVLSCVKAGVTTSYSSPPFPCCWIGEGGMGKAKRSKGL